MFCMSVKSISLVDLDIFLDYYYFFDSNNLKVRTLKLIILIVYCILTWPAQIVIIQNGF